MKPLRVLTCTPVAFRGDHTFFARESGLLSRGLRMAGIYSFAVMPLPAQDGDEEGLIRASVEQLQDASWWRSHSADAVVFYSWAMPEYAPVSRAIKASGAKLLLYLDASGLWNPWSDGKDWFRAYWIFNTRTHGRLWGPTRFLLGALRQSIPATLAKPRLEHMALADVIGTGSPGALARTKRYAETFGFGHITDRMVLSPPPIPVHFRYESEQKKKRVICVARWLKPDRAQKNPAMLLASLVLFHLASFEAACCGCSIVALDSPDLPALQWLAASDGTLAHEAKPESFATALLAEAAKWENGHRSAKDISHRWSSELHADKAAARVLRQLALAH